MDTLNYIAVIKQQILMVNTCQLTTKCKGNKVVCLKWQVSLWLGD